MPLGIYGEWRYKETRKQYTDISVSTGDYVGEHSQDIQEESFWHELTHAILHDMKAKKLNDDEAFVINFSRRLHHAIKSARFE
jgi:hypothetical protein